MSTLENIRDGGIRFTYIGKRVKNVFEWQPFIRIQDWFENNIVLNRAARAGKFQTRYVPHAEGIFEDIDKQEVNISTLMSSSQVIKTTIGMGFIMKYIDTDPSDSMIMIPRATDLKIYSENKLKPFVDGVEPIKAKFSAFKSTEKVRDNSYIYRFAGGVLNLLSSNNPKTISVKYALFDEASEFSRGKIGEALERMKSYLMFGYKALIVSTQESELDEINFYFNSSEVKKQYCMYCSECQGHFYPEFEHIKYPSQAEYKEKHDIDPETELKDFEVISDYLPYAARNGYLECPECNHHITDQERRRSILDRKLKWFQVIPTIEEVDGEEVIVYRRAERPKESYSTVGFDVNTLCMYNVPLSESIDRIIKADVSKDKDVELDYFYRGYLNRIYKPSHKKRISKNDILLLSNGLQRGVVPNDTWKLFLIADNQKDHLYYELKAFTYDNVAHSVMHGMLQGYGMGEDFAELEELMFKTYYSENGEPYKVSKVGIDRRGYISKEDGIDRIADVDKFILGIRHKLKMNGVVDFEDFIFATQGVDKIAGDKYYKINKIKREFHGEEVEMPVVVLNNLLLKNRLQNSINRSVAKVKAAEGDDALKYESNLFYINQTIVDDAEAKGGSVATDYERMLTSEAFDSTLGMWVNKVKRNDYWDTSYGAVGMALMSGVDFVEKPSPQKANEAFDVLNSIF